MGFNSFADNVGEQISKRVSRYASATSSGAKAASTIGMNRGRAATARVFGGMSPQTINRSIGYGAMGAAVGSVAYGANKMRRKSKSTS
jgi:hypothetical protein